MIRLFDKTVDIGWASWSRSIHNSHWREVLVDKPEKVLAQKLVQGDVRYCPAFGAFYKNVYAIKMPFNLNLIKRNNKVVLGPHSNINVPDNELESFITIVHQDAQDRTSIQVMLNNTFVSDTPYTIVETLPPILHGCREEIIYLNGRMDCHAWQRPLQFGFQLSKENIDKMNEDDSIILQKGEVVMYVRFITPKDQPVKLYTMDMDDIERMSKYAQRNISLPFMMRRFNFAEVIDRVRYRRPKKFLRNKKYDRGE